MTDSRLEALFCHALAVSRERREALAFAEARGDWELFRAVCELLRHHEGNDSLLDRPLTLANDLADLVRAEIVPYGPGETVRTPTAEYRILRRAGAGGMGIVFEADQLVPVRRRVALKLLRTPAPSSTARRWFAWEGQALALMQHPSVAGIYECGTTSDHLPFLAMEFVEGDALLTHCDRRNASLSEQIQLMIDICAGVQHAHDRGIIHRDLKPSHILVTGEDQRWQPRIIDFGVARIADHLLADAGPHAREGPRVGSPRSMSPEQLDDDARVDVRSDVYALGLLLYELLTGTHPLDIAAPARRDVLEQRIRWEDPPLPSELVASRPANARKAAAAHPTGPRLAASRLRGDLDAIVMKALRKSPGGRYRSAAELAGDLGRFLRHEPVLARPDVAGYRLSKFLRRNRPSVIASAVTLLALLATLLVNVRLLRDTGRVYGVVQSQHEDLRRLGDVKRLQWARERALEIVPPTPDRIPELEQWLANARELASGLPAHRRTLHELLATVPTPEVGRDPDFPGPEQAFHYHVLSTLVAELEEFAGSSVRIGNIAEMSQRLEFAKRLRDAPHDERWEEAATAIRAAARYGGLVLHPQAGLLPLGPDPESGLWEFAHLYSGNPPLRDPSGALVLTERSGIVLVLIPGGCYLMGATRASGRAGQCGDDLAVGDEAPIHQVCLDPFFLAKHEVTQAQWRRITGASPSMFPERSPCSDVWEPSKHPVENISWGEAQQGARVMGLVLPTEAQWEFAARAGVAAPWFTGWEAGRFAGFGNVSDPCREIVMGADPVSPQRWNDGYGETAPIGSYRPNAFGLHDVIGNVIEWCQDFYGSYERPVAPGTGLRLVDDSPERVARGGDFSHAIRAARISRRMNLSPGSRTRLGVRPALALGVAWPQPPASASYP